MWHSCIAPSYEQFLQMNDLEIHSRLSEMTIAVCIWRTWRGLIGYILFYTSIVCSHNVFILHRFRDITTLTAYVTARDLEKSFRYTVAVPYPAFLSFVRQMKIQQSVAGVLIITVPY